jgi:hypothetical protein
MTSERFLKFMGRVEFEVGDGEIGCLIGSRVGHASVEFAADQSLRLQPRDDELVVVVKIIIIICPNLYHWPRPMPSTDFVRDNLPIRGRAGRAPRPGCAALRRWLQPCAPPTDIMSLQRLRSMKEVLARRTPPFATEWTHALNYSLLDPQVRA